MPLYLRCRLCADFKILSSLISINNKAAQTLSLRSKVKDCFDIDLQELHYHHVPKHVCLPCCEKVDIFFDFKEKVRKAQQIFRLPNKKSAIKKEEVPGSNDKQIENVKSKNDENFIKENLQENYTNFCTNNVDQNKSNEVLNDDDVSSGDNNIPDFNEELLDNIGNKNDIKEEELQQETSDENGVYNNYNDYDLKGPNLTENTEIEKEESIPSEGLAAQRITWRTPKRSELDAELAIDSAERSESIIKYSEAWKSYKWKCCICKKMLPSIGKLRTHFLKVHDKIPQYSCMNCTKVFESYRRFRLHQRNHRNDFNYKCPKCKKTFNLKEHYDKHLETHDPKNKKVEEYKCSVCDKVYKTRSLWIIHEISHKRGPQYKCQKCVKVYFSSTGLMSHQKVHDQGSRITYTCEKCGKSFTHNAGLRYHNEAAHSDEVYSCTKCPKTFKTRNTLRNHIGTHDTEKKYVCEICSARFRTNLHLTAHKKVHTNNFPFECDYCHKKFRRTCDLAVHKRRHTGERPYYCEQCNLSFIDSSNCLKHMKNKHNIHSVRKYVI